MAIRDRRLAFNSFGCESNGNCTSENWIHCRMVTLSGQSRNRRSTYTIRKSISKCWIDGTPKETEGPNLDKGMAAFRFSSNPKSHQSWPGVIQSQINQWKGTALTHLFIRCPNSGVRQCSESSRPTLSPYPQSSSQQPSGISEFQKGARNVQMIVLLGPIHFRFALRFAERRVDPLCWRYCWG